MNNFQETDRGIANASGDDGGNRSAAGQFTTRAASELGQSAQRVAEQAKSAASTAVSEAKEQVTTYVDKQVGSGAEVAAKVARSIRYAADDLEQGVPMLAGLVRGAADRVDTFSDSIRDRSAAELFANAQDFTRRHPAIVISTAVALGFAAYRLLTPAPSRNISSEHQRFPSRENESDRVISGAEWAPERSLRPSAMGHPKNLERPYGS
jgi:hypothetical protein